MRPAEDIDKLIKKLRYKTGAETHERILGNVMQALDETEKQKSGATAPNIWRTIMKSPVTKIAAAAVIIIAVLIGIHQLGGSVPAFADIVQPLLTARTATFKITVNMEGEPSLTVDCMFMEPGLTRQVYPGGVIRILHQDQYHVIMLYPAEKKAMIIDPTNIPKDKQRHTNWFLKIRERIRQAQETEDESVKFIGKQKIDGVRALGYRIGENSDIMDTTVLTVWADAESLLPIQMEYSISSASAINRYEGTITYSDIVFNVELDESLFVVPEGYDVHTIQLDASQPGEEELIQTLRLWAENTDGKFPSELNANAAGELFQLIKEKMGLKLEEGKAPDFDNPQFSEFYPIQPRIIRGLGFVAILPSESNWHYAGKGAKLGDADTPIFWYRPEGSETYRVIFGDLSVKDVTPENLPK